MSHICPFGHELRPGEVLVGWSPCACPPAWAVHKGHQTLQCRACEREGQTVVRYMPEHIGPGHPGR
ncbi:MULTISPECIES: hypothetical protein [Actinomadura]|uniref:hypothetical protein n=1 Tax=Actinomadura TaxID=1988 RepID=UPI000479A9CE|nr:MULTISPECIES: hypothetical protein [Actinomadura]RSN72043.1 hypothetical protein DMH08_00585 [Actinomadura sp. WAC 06369]